MNIEFNYLGIEKKFSHSAEAHKLIKYLVGRENKKLGEINIVFTDNSNILSINKTYLKHNYFTDVITFDNGFKDTISGEIFISVEQVILNSKKYNTGKLEELLRVIVHGVLHLIGYMDDNEQNKKVMTLKEDTYLCALREDTILEKDELVL